MTESDTSQARRENELSVNDERQPRVGPVLETALYVADLEASVEFYRRALGFAPASEPSDRLCALTVTPDQVLLLFKKGASVRPTVTPFGTIPPTDGDGALHVAFAIPESDFDAWRDRLGHCGISIESVVSWPEGGRSLYFRDPDHHAIELKTSNWFGKELHW